MADSLAATATAVPAVVAAQRALGSTLLAAAPLIAETALAMARRFAAGGRLLVVGDDTCASDAQHIAVEFVHPVIVGKRALAALVVEPEQVELLARPDDIALVVQATREPVPLLGVLDAATQRGVLCVHLVAAAGAPETQDSAIYVEVPDERLAKQALVTSYHLLWELVHVFLDHLDGAVMAP